MQKGKTNPTVKANGKKSIETPSMTDQQRKLQFQEEKKAIEDKINKILDEASIFERKLQEEESLAPYRHIAIAFIYLDVVDYYCKLASHHKKLMKKTNETFLGDARKYYVKALQELEEVWTKWVEPDKDDINERLEAVKRFTPPRQRVLLNQLKNRLEQLKEAYGELPKWKWFFVEMEARCAVVVKNSINFKDSYSNDPRQPFFEDRTSLIHMIQEMLNQAAEHYREKYMVSTKEIDDMRKGIELMEALRKVNLFLGNDQESETCKKKRDAWKSFLEKEIQNKDAKKKGRKR